MPEQPPTGSAKRPYVSPTLNRFGAMAVTTQGGTGRAAEGSMTMDTMRRP